VRLFTPLRPNPASLLAAANPVAKLGAALALMAALFLSVDPLTPAIIDLVLLSAIPLTGLAPRDLAARTWPILVAAVAIGLLNIAFAAAPAGDELLRIGPLVVGSQSTLTGLGLGLRLIGVAFAGVLALATTDPTDLADSLQQQLHLSPRIAVGALAAVRLMPVLAEEWQIMALARRARGESARRSPPAALRIFSGRLLALLVAAVRRATRLAAAMEARGFGAAACRSLARPQPLRAADWRLMAATLAIAAGAVAASVALGRWRFLFG
jgi:energy-coupling factor transport system permease protein